MGGSLILSFILLLLACYLGTVKGAVYLQLGSQSFPDNTVILTSDIGNLDQADPVGLLCRSNLSTPTVKRWIYPDGTEVSRTKLPSFLHGVYTGDNTDISDGNGGVFLYRVGTIESSLLGIYTCEITDNDNVEKFIQFGLYNDEIADGDLVIDESGAVSVDSNVQLYCNSSGLPATTVQWSKDGSSLSGLSSSQVITDAANAVYFNELVVGAADSTGSFTCMVTAQNGISGAMATVSATVSTELVVTVHPVDQTGIAPGSDVSFSVTATGTAPLSYQWQKDGVTLTDEGRITGATTATLTITGVMESDEGGYRCVVTNIAGMDTSDTAMLTVANPPQVTDHPVDQVNIVPGSDVAFSVTATGTAPLSYQWQKDGVDLTDGGSITGATTATLTITGVMESDEGGYRCVVTNIAGTVTSDTATLTVVDQPPQVTVHPVDQTDIVPGSDVSFSMTATGTAPLSYQWQKDGMDLTDGCSITGATTTTLTITGVMESDEGGYRCVVSNSLGMDTSNTAMLTVVENSNGMATAVAVTISVIVTSIVMFFLGALTSALVICLCCNPRRLKAPQTTTSGANTPDALAMEGNEAYGQRMEMAENIAYDDVAKQMEIKENVAYGTLTEQSTAVVYERID